MFYVQCNVKCLKKITKLNILVGACDESFIFLVYLTKEAAVEYLSSVV